MTPNLTDDRDIARSKRAICIIANMLLIKFCYCSSEIKHCGNIYCEHFWADYPEYHPMKIMVLYNNAFRIIIII